MTHVCVCWQVCCFQDLGTDVWELTLDIYSKSRDTRRDTSRNTHTHTKHILFRCFGQSGVPVNMSALLVTFILSNISPKQIHFILHISLPLSL